MSPLPATSVVDPRMRAMLGRVAQAAQTSACQLLHPESKTGAGTFDPATGTYPTPVLTVLWSGSCRVQAKVRANVNAVDAAGDITALTQYQVTVPADATPVKVDDLILITASSDAQLVGRLLRVGDVLFGELEAERHLLCQDDSERAERVSR